MKPITPPSSLFSCPACRQRALFAFQSDKPLSRARHVPNRTYTHPSTAPKPTIDMKHIRQNPGLYEENCINRNYASKSRNSWQILELFEGWQACQRQARSLREARNANKKRLSEGAAAKTIQGQAGDGGESTMTSKESLLEEARQIKEKLVDLEAEEKQCEEKMEELALDLPNLSSNFTPIGEEADLLGYINEPPSKENQHNRSHVQIGTDLDLLDFSAAANVSGWGWYYLKNEAALLEQALIQYSLAQARAHGFNLISPPSMVYAHMASACGFAPRDQNGEQQIYAIEQSTRDKGKPSLVMAGTAEIPLAAMKSGVTMEEKDLPMKVVGVSRSYRAEAGARGADTKGLYRVHEFTKVEMFAWTRPDALTTITPQSEGGEEGNFDTSTGSTSSTPDNSSPAETTSSQADDVFKTMLTLQTKILTDLGLHARILEMPSSDLGASATRKIDIEAWFPSRASNQKSKGWGEVSSLSLCTDYQTRRLATRVKVKGKGGKLEFPWTLNGTALAVPRVLAAILENGWDEEARSVRVPECLWGYMGGVREIRRG